MRIRKGHRCLPLPPADRSSLQDASAQRERDVGVSDDAKDGAKQALVSLVALASASAVADNVIAGPLLVQQEHAKATSAEGNKRLEPELEKNRVSADDDFNYRSSSFRNAGVVDSTTVREPTETPPGAKSINTRHEPLDTTGTISCSTSAVEIRHQSDLLEQSLCHICSTAGMTGLSVRDAVAQMIEQGLPGLNGEGEGLVEQVAKSFRHSSKFLECEEPGRYYLRDLPTGEEKKLLTTGDPESHHEKTVSGSDMLGAAKHLQYLQKSRSDSLGSGVVEPSETPSVHGDDQKAVQNMTQGFVRQAKVGTVHKDVTAMNHNSSSRASKSWKATQMVASVSQCRRDDGRGWRCSKPPQAGFTLCKYHRDLIIQGYHHRRKKARLEAGLDVLCKDAPFRHVANARVMPDAIGTETSWSPFLDDELSCDENRQFVKAKSIRSILLNSDVRPRHF